jgi:hypothetical protein
MPAAKSIPLIFRYIPTSLFPVNSSARAEIAAPKDARAAARD